MISPREQSGVRWRRFRPKQSLFYSPAGVVPLFNLIFLIMLFMIFQARFVRQPAMAVSLPGSAFASGEAYDTAVVALTREGMVFFNDERVPLDDLAGSLSRKLREKPSLSITIESDIRVPYGMIMRVANMASAAGFRRIHLATRPTFGEEAMP